MFKINSERELLQLLRAVSQEAVLKSKKELNENTDNAQERYINRLRTSEQNYGVNLSEQEEEEAPAPEKEKEAPEETEAEPEEEEMDPEKFGVSFDSVIKDINTLRAGRSTKDKEIKDELLGYYDRLDEDERKILHLFLRELSKILQGAIDAAGAVDPSDPPFNLDVVGSGEEKSAEDTPSQSKQQATTSDTSAGRERGEDTSPPIKVNERQELNEIRRKVKRLMKRVWCKLQKENSIK